MSTADSDSLTTAPDGRPEKDQPQWRQEFPVDWSQSEYVTRREFARLLLVTSFAFVVGQAWILASSHFRRRRLPQTAIATTDEVPVQGVKLFRFPTDKDPCVLVRLSADEYVAYSQKCTHLSCPVIPQPETGRIRCPCHEGSFDLRTGAVLAGPPERPLPRIGLEIRAGRIYATDVREGTL